MAFSIYGYDHKSNYEFQKNGLFYIWSKRRQCQRDTNDTNEGDNTKDEDDDDNDEIDKEISYKNDHESDEIDDNLLNLIIRTNAKLKEFGYKNLIINCSSDFIRIGKNSGGAIEVNLNNQWDTEMDHYPAQGGQLSISCMKMGESLFTLLQHIHKLPTPPPIADTLQICDHDQYRVVLLRHLSRINNVNEFCNSSIFLTNDGVSTSSHWTKELGESSKNSYNTGAMIYYYDSVVAVHLINLILSDLLFRGRFYIITTTPSEERETEIKAACSKLSKNIFDIYETSLEKSTSRLYEKRSISLLSKNITTFSNSKTYFKIYHERNKGQTIKTNVIRSIIKSGGNGHLELTGNKLKLIIQRAKRIERLLNLANNNYNIFDAFPDLNITFFSANRMNTYNYERWLILVKPII
ncbi:unnamed protein product [Rhizophagus irregularis]|nr:unnamed protein product [Rhizophagus irregularis]